MVYELLIDQRQLQQVENNFSSHVRTSLKSAVDKKNRILKAKNVSKKESLSAEFHQHMDFDLFWGYELTFSAQSNVFRAIFLLDEDQNSLKYYSAVPKNNSDQDRMIDLIDNNSERIKEHLFGTS